MGSRYTPPGATSALAVSDRSTMLENPGEMNLVLLTVLPTLLLAQMLTLSEGLMICFEI